MKSYSKKVKCIYIDPPYNTGTDGFVYNDKFNFTVQELEEKLSIDETQAQRIIDLTKRGSASHSAWLMFMYPRLQLARELLADDGVIFISIDDNEQANLKLLCDDVFGEENFVGNIIIKSNPCGSQSEAEIAQLHEYLLVYGKTRVEMDIVGHELTKEMLSEYKYTLPTGEKYRLLGLRQRGGFWRASERPTLYYPIYIDPISCTTSLSKNDVHNIEVFPIQPSTNELGSWRWSKETVLKDINLVIGKSITRNGAGDWDIFEVDLLTNKDGTVRRTKAKSIWDDKEINYQNGTSCIKELFGSEVFSYSKPCFLINKALQMLMNEDSLILDFFSGSATTAHAVMQLNAEDGGKRKYILVQLQEKCREVSEAVKAGYETIDQIGMERIIRAGKKIKEETGADIDYGFKHFTLCEPQEETLDKLIEFDPAKINYREQNLF